MKLEYQKTNQDSYQTIKEVLKANFGISDRLLLQLKKEQAILLNGSPTPLWYSIQVGDILTVLLTKEEENSHILPTPMDLNIIYEDDAYLVLNKPAGISTHPSMAHYTDSLSNGVQFYFNQIGLKKKIRPVNRLDKNTSGLILFAKNEYVQYDFSKQMQSHTFHKTYLAIAQGIITPPQGTICAPIARKENSIIERCVSPTGEPAITKYEVLKQMPEHCLVACTLITGRTHQIRVHMKHIGHPLIGDFLYGTESSTISRQALHSYQMDFIHPVTHAKMHYQVELPEDMKKLLFIQ